MHNSKSIDDNITQAIAQSLSEEGEVEVRMDLADALSLTADKNPKSIKPETATLIAQRLSKEGDLEVLGHLAKALSFTAKNNSDSITAETAELIAQWLSQEKDGEVSQLLTKAMIATAENNSSSITIAVGLILVQRLANEQQDMDLSTKQALASAVYVVFGRPLLEKAIPFGLITREEANEGDPVPVWYTQQMEEELAEVLVAQLVEEVAAKELYPATFAAIVERVVFGILFEQLCGGDDAEASPSGDTELFAVPKSQCRAASSAVESQDPAHLMPQLIAAKDDAPLRRELAKQLIDKSKTITAPTALVIAQWLFEEGDVGVRRYLASALDWTAINNPTAIDDKSALAIAQRLSEENGLRKV